MGRRAGRSPPAAAGLQLGGPRGGSGEAPLDGVLGSSVAIAVLLRAGRRSGLGARCMWWVYGLGCSPVHTPAHTRYAYRRGAISVSPLLAVPGATPPPLPCRPTQRRSADSGASVSAGVSGRTGRPVWMGVGGGPGRDGFGIGVWSSSRRRRVVVSDCPAAYLGDQRNERRGPASGAVAGWGDDQR